MKTKVLVALAALAVVVLAVVALSAASTARSSTAGGQSGSYGSGGYGGHGMDHHDGMGSNSGWGDSCGCCGGWAGQNSTWGHGYP